MFLCRLIFFYDGDVHPGCLNAGEILGISKKETGTKCFPANNFH